MLPESLPADASKYDAIFIDTPSEADHRLWKLVEISDYAIVPIAAGYQDLELTVKVADTLAFVQARKKSLLLHGILNQWNEKAPISGTILRNLERLADRFPVASSILQHRSEYSTAFSYGVGVQELDLNSAAATEVTALYTELFLSQRPSL
jgi:cellulose biosynthesis protein BcsQ